MEVVKQPEEQTIESLSQELAATKAELETTKAELASTQAINADLTKEIESLSVKEAHTGSEPVFEIEGSLFGFHFHKVVFAGKNITHTDVLSSTELQKQLIEAGSGMIFKK